LAVTVNVDDGFSAAPGTMIASIEGDPSRRFVNKDTVSNSSGVPADETSDFEAETAGAIPCPSGTLTVIAEPLTGWNSVTNPTDGEIGREVDTDAELRTRREDELAAVGSTTADAIRSDVLRNLEDNVTHCRVLANDTAEEDANGVPAYSFEVIARGLVTDATESTRLAEQIAASKSAGDRAYGTSSEVVTDSQGNDDLIGYTWVSDQNVYLEADLTIDEDLFPEDGDDQIKAALVAIEDTYEPGSDVIAERLKAACFSVTGVVDVPELRLGFSASPVGTTNLSIAIREIGAIDTGRILVTHV
jgi:uncharacterized phage protein gp47/JayE